MTPEARAKRGKRDIRPAGRRGNRRGRAKQIGLALGAIVLLVLLFVAFTYLRPELQLAPDFRLPEAGGGELSLSSLRGKPLILVFYRSYHSPSSRERLDAFQKKYKEIKELGGEVVFISVENMELVRAMKRDRGLDAPVLSDENYVASKGYGVFNLLGDELAAPSVFIIDRKGYITWKHVGTSAADRPRMSQVMSKFRRVASQ